MRSERYLEAAEPTAQRLLTLARGRVYERLARALPFAITVLCAAPGFGKSTVLREFLELRGQPNRRLILEPKHGDLLDFMRALATCFGDVAPTLLTSLRGVYERVSRADDAVAQIAAWAADLIIGVGESIVVDGLENAVDERIMTLVVELIDRTADSGLRWIVVTRSATALPVARWLANDRMDLPLDEVDFELTFDDCAAAVIAANSSLSLDRLGRLCASAANWPAALALLLSDVTTLTNVSSQRQTYEYFADLAFMRRSGTEQQFLLETCLYRSLDLLLLTVAGWDDADAMLARLSATGAFVYVQADGTYRYHEMFRAFLEDRLRTSASELYSTIAAATASNFRAVGRWSDALELYTDLQAATPLASLLTDHGFELLDRGELDGVSRALRLLGDAEFALFPVALALKASLESLHGSFDVAESWFRHAIDSVGDSEQLAAIVFRFATDLVRRDRPDAIDLLQPIVERGGHEVGLAVSLAGLLATAYATHHMDTEAAHTIERALAQLADVDDTAIQAKLLFQAGYVALFARDPIRAKAFAQRAVASARESQLYDIAARALSILYNVAMDYEDDTAASRDYLEQLAACSVKAGSRHLLTYATLGQYEIEVLCGNLAQSARLDETLKSLEIDYSVIATETLLPAQALRATWMGDFQRAYSLVAPTAEKQITPVRRAQRYAEIALYAAAAGLRAQASTAASRALATVPKAERGDKAVALTKAYVALALTLLGRRGRAMQILTKLARSPELPPRLEMLIRAIRAVNERWTRGRYSAGLRSALDRLDACDFGGIARLIEALPLPDTFRDGFEALTAVEREMLVHLSAGLTSAQIARSSLCSVESVEQHIRSLCRKLGCRDARQAVALASADGPRVDVAEQAVTGT